MGDCGRALGDRVRRGYVRGHFLDCGEADGRGRFLAQSVASDMAHRQPVDAAQVVRFPVEDGFRGASGAQVSAEVPHFQDVVVDERSVVPAEVAAYRPTAAQVGAAVHLRYCAAS